MSWFLASVILGAALILIGVGLQVRGSQLVTRAAGDRTISLWRSEPEAPLPLRAWQVGGIVTMGAGVSLWAGARVLPAWALLGGFLLLVALTWAWPMLRHNRAVARRRSASVAP